MNIERVIKGLDRILCEVDVEDRYSLKEFAELKVEDCGVLDPQGICFIVPKTTEAKYAMWKFLDKNAERRKLLIKYEKLPAGGSHFNIEYIRKILEIIEYGEEDDDAIITTAKDYPMLIESETFKFYLAPRIPEENEGDAK